MVVEGLVKPCVDTLSVSGKSSKTTMPVIPRRGPRGSEKTALSLRGVSTGSVWSSTCKAWRHEWAGGQCWKGGMVCGKLATLKTGLRERRGEALGVIVRASRMSDDLEDTASGDSLRERPVPIMQLGGEEEVVWARLRGVFMCASHLLPKVVAGRGEDGARGIGGPDDIIAERPEVARGPLAEG